MRCLALHYVILNDVPETLPDMDLRRWVYLLEKSMYMQADLQPGD